MAAVATKGKFRSVTVCDECRQRTYKTRIPAAVYRRFVRAYKTGGKRALGAAIDAYYKMTGQYDLDDSYVYKATWVERAVVAEVTGKELSVIQVW